MQPDQLTLLYLYRYPTCTWLYLTWSCHNISVISVSSITTTSSSNPPNTSQVLFHLHSGRKRNMDSVKRRDLDGSINFDFHVTEPGSDGRQRLLLSSSNPPWLYFLYLHTGLVSLLMRLKLFNHWHRLRPTNAVYCMTSNNILAVHNENILYDIICVMYTVWYMCNIYSVICYA